MRFWFRTAVLTALLFLISAVDVADLRLSPEWLQAPLWRLLIAAAFAVPLALAIRRSRWHGWGLSAAVFLAHFDMNAVVTAVEGVYLPTVASQAQALLLNGAVTAAVFAPLAVAFLGRWRPRPGVEAAGLGRAWGLLWKLPVIGMAYMLMFALVGALVFAPIARAIAPGALEGYTDLPSWVLPFQAGRAILWTALALPLLHSLKGRWTARGAVLGFLFAAPLAVGVLAPNDVFPAALRLAHFFEVGVENLLLGLLVAWLLTTAGSRQAAPRRSAHRSPRTSRT